MGNKGRTWRRRRMKLARDNPISLAAKPEYIALLQWAKKNGVFFHNMRPAVFSGIGRGLMAASKIEIGDILISVPRDLLITDNMIKHRYFANGDFLRSDINTIDLLCLFLIVEHSLGSASFWFPYITMLPKQFNTPSYFSAKELEIVPAFFTEQHYSQLRDIEKCLKSLKHLEKFVSYEIQKNIDISFENVRWAWSIVNTRSVYMDCELGSAGNGTMSCALAPLLDLLNHSCDVEVQAGFSQVMHSYNICTKTKFNKGSQVFINYGPHNNRKLLVEYGFILPTNCHNNIKIEPSDVYNIVSRNHTDISVLKYSIIAKYNLEETYSCTCKGLSWSLTTALKIIAVDDTRLEKKSVNIADLDLTTKDECLIRVFSRDILKSLLDDYNLNYSRLRTKVGKDYERSSLDQINQLTELLSQEIEIIRNALTLVAKVI